MFAVKGVYDGKSIAIDEPVPVAGKYAVVVTFLYSVEKEEKENIEENIKKFREKHEDAFVEHLKVSLAEGKTFDFNAQAIIDGNENEEDRQARYELEKNAWAMSVTERAEKWKA